MFRKKKKSYIYDAFLSYAHEDEITVEWLEKVLGKTWIPGKRRRSIYRDRNKLRSGLLTGELLNALQQSEYLIVCCSKDAVASPWIEREITAFCQSDSTRRPKSILVCKVGEDIGNQDIVPNTLLKLQNELGDEYYIADLTGNPINALKRENVRFKREAFALLAPLVGLPDREAVRAGILKRQLLLGSLALVCLIAIAAIFTWTRSDVYQVKNVITSGTETLKGAEFRSVEQWIKTLAEIREVRLAEGIAGDVQDPFERIQALTTVAKEISQDLSSEHLIIQALSTLEEIQDGYEYVTALESITITRHTPLPAITNSAINAIKHARNIEHPQLKGQTLASLIKVFAVIRKKDSVRSLTQEVMGILDSISPDYQAWILGTISGAFQMISDSVEAEYYGKQALLAVNKIAARRRRIDGYVDLANNFRTSLQMSAGLQALDLATSELQDSIGPVLRIFLIQSIYKTLLSFGKVDLANRLIRQSANVIHEVEDPAEVSQSSSVLAGLLSSAGASNDAKRAANLAISKLDNIEDTDRKADIYAEVLGNIINLLPRDMGLKHIQIAMRLAKNHNSDRGRSIAMIHLSKACAIIGEFRRARLLAEMSPVSSDRLDGYMILLREYFQLGPVRD